MIISAVVAMSPDRVIGLNNQIPWYLPADLKFFKKQTTGHHILMGRKCYDSIGKPLPNRTNIIVTRDPYFIVSNCLIAHSLEEGIYIAKSNEENELMIIGGGEIYQLAMPFISKIYLTIVDYSGIGDVFFPPIDFEGWKIISEEHHEKDVKNTMNYTFQTLLRNDL
ncbi:MAG: dihydrofolate reductase [Bacteroidota bacterium]|nr:dihydrofolate reductase [Bacteroidota bacterium]